MSIMGTRPLIASLTAGAVAAVVAAAAAVVVTLVVRARAGWRGAPAAVAGGAKATHFAH